MANLASAKAYATLEFWFAMIKVVTIIFMIIVGLLVITVGLGNHWHPVGISNLWTHGGFFPNGLKGFVFAMAVIAGSYQGVELLGSNLAKIDKISMENLDKRVKKVNFIWISQHHFYQLRQQFLQIELKN